MTNGALAGYILHETLLSMDDLPGCRCRVVITSGIINPSVVVLMLTVFQLSSNYIRTV